MVAESVGGGGNGGVGGQFGGPGGQMNVGGNSQLLAGGNDPLTNPGHLINPGGNGQLINPARLMNPGGNGQLPSSGQVNLAFSTSPNSSGNVQFNPPANGLHNFPFNPHSNDNLNTVSTIPHNNAHGIVNPTVNPQLAPNNNLQFNNNFVSGFATPTGSIQSLPSGNVLLNPGGNVQFNPGGNVAFNPGSNPQLNTSGNVHLNPGSNPLLHSNPSVQSIPGSNPLLNPSNIPQPDPKNPVQSIPANPTKLNTDHRGSSLNSLTKIDLSDDPPTPLGVNGVVFSLDHLQRTASPTKLSSTDSLNSGVLSNSGVLPNGKNHGSNGTHGSEARPGTTPLADVQVKDQKPQKLATLSVVVTVLGTLLALTAISTSQWARVAGQFNTLFYNGNFRLMRPKRSSGSAHDILSG